jgi:hypothetical protein
MRHSLQVKRPKTTTGAQAQDSTGKWDSTDVQLAYESYVKTLNGWSLYTAEYG